VRFEFESEIVLFCFSFIFVSFGESCLLVSWSAGGRCGIAYSDEDRDRSRRPGAKDRGWSHKSCNRWPGGRVAPCAVCTWHVETRSTSFLVEPQNQGRRFVSNLASKSVGRLFVGLASKPVAMVSSGLASKPAAMVSGSLASKPAAMVSGGLAPKSAVMVSHGSASKPAGTVSSSLASKPTRTVCAGLASKPVATFFSSLGSKLVVMVSPDLASKPVVGFLVEPPNQGGGGFLGVGLKTGSFGLVIWA
jgi:hypothetical protein